MGTASVVRGIPETGYEAGEDRLWKESGMRRMSVIVAGTMVVAGLGSGVAAAGTGAPAPGVGEQARTAVVAVPCPPFGSPVLCTLAKIINPLLPGTGSAGL
ncbi:hypothetical protein FEK35_20785 [Nocardia cyriacigeorgica]|uniref:Uncharacterized protein n=1 Tax=Nocardia cyriacigeorgica TaxID=135487 RepID=A0A5R8PAL5_9NOCA|nr:hypothetical protein [Nocardia cyriacigeorgica]TLG03783.1 hypothetical protein FEK35_20785 [Nocardia cyriacigeorgica]